MDFDLSLGVNVNFASERHQGFEGFGDAAMNAVFDRDEPTINVTSRDAGENTFDQVLRDERDAAPKVAHARDVAVRAERAKEADGEATFQGE